MTTMTPMRGGTKRDKSRTTDGGKLAAVAKALGTPLLPWQQYVADTALEIDPQTGTYYYDYVVLSTPRQCGKSTLLDALMTYDCLIGDHRYTYYLAQTGKDASDHFAEYLKKLDDSPVLSYLATQRRRTNGAMGQWFFDGSAIRPMSVTKVAGHGVQGDLICLDEAFSFTAATGKAVLDAFLPTTATRLKTTAIQPQVWITSTEGDADSTFFNPILDACRRGKCSQHQCWFDWGIPADSDATDLENIYRHHPAAGILWDWPQLGRWKSAFGQDVKGFARAYGNKRDTGVTDTAIDPIAWTDSTCQPIQPDSLSNQTLAFGVAVDIDGASTSIAAGIKTDGVTTVQLIEILPGTGTAPAEIQRLCHKYNAPVAIDTKGTAAPLRDTLENLDDPKITFADISSSDFMAAAPSFAAGLENHTVTHAADADLDASSATAARAWSGDTWRITRRGSHGKTSPLEASILAAWAVSHQPETGIQIF